MGIEKTVNKEGFLEKQGLKVIEAKGAYGGNDQAILFIYGENRLGGHVKHLRGHVKRLFCDSCPKNIVAGNTKVACDGMDPNSSNFRHVRVKSKNGELSSESWKSVIQRFPCRP